MRRATTKHDAGGRSGTVGLARGAVAGGAAFVAAALAVAVLAVADLLVRYPLAAILSAPEVFLLDVAWLLNAAHAGAARPPLVLLAPVEGAGLPGGVFYAVPPAALLVAGAALVRRSLDGPTPRAAAVSGATVVAGYLPGAVVLFAALAAQLELVPPPPGRALAVVGVAYPVAFGALGGVAAAWLTPGHAGSDADRREPGTARPTAVADRRTAGDDAPADRQAPSAGRDGTDAGWGTDADNGTDAGWGTDADNGSDAGRATGADDPTTDRRDRPAGTSGARARGGRTTAAVHFEETLSTARSDRLVVAAFALLFGVPVLAADVAVLAGVVPVESAGDAVPLLFGNLVVPAILYLGVRSLGNEVHVRVTDDGVDVSTDGEPLFGSGEVFVPFEAVTAVHYSGPDGGHIRVTAEDRKQQRRSMREADGFVTVASTEHRPRLFKVPSRERTATTYSDGVRIGREGAPPVYVGSDRARELADAIVERAPGVAAAEQL